MHIDTPTSESDGARQKWVTPWISCHFENSSLGKLLQQLNCAEVIASSKTSLAVASLTPDSFAQNIFGEVGEADQILGGLKGHGALFVAY